MAVEEALWKMLEVNMNYVPGEKVGLVLQVWDDKLDDGKKDRFKKSKEITDKMYEVFQNHGVDVEMFSYVPEEARNGVDAPDWLYEDIGHKDILVMPTAFSLTHTQFRKEQSEKGTRIASCAGLKLRHFERGGPMDVDYRNVHRMTMAVADKLRQCNYVHVTGEGTDIWVEVNNDLVITSDGMITGEGEYGNLPGAESFVVPVHEGDTHGYITVPEGWGGQERLQYPVKFIIEDGRFVDAVGETGEAQEYIDQEVKPIVFGEKDYNILAELGIGTNPAVDEEYIIDNEWTTLVAEKVFGSAHFANGNSAAMGGKNDVPVHVDWVVPDVEITYHEEKEV